MPKFVTAHVTSCMTRQDLEKLIERLGDGADNAIHSLRILSDTIEGRMICEWEAPDQESLLEWLATKNLRFRGSDEWLMRVQLDVRDGKFERVV